MWRHQVLDVKEETKVMQGWSSRRGTPRFESYVQVMSHSLRGSRPGMLSRVYDCRAMSMYEKCIRKWNKER